MSRQGAARMACSRLLTIIPMYNTSMNRVFRIAMVGVVLALLLGAGAPVGAQNVRTLTIRDGKVLIDDREVPEKDLPASLDLQDIEATYTFAGDMSFRFQLGEVFYVFDNEGLREASKVYFVDGRSAGRVPFSAFLVQAQALQESTQELDELSRQFEQSPLPAPQQANLVLKKARFQVAQAAQVVGSLPRLEVQSYFSDVWRSDQNLYALLIRELRLEREAAALAREIRSLPDGNLRQSRIEQLREKLYAIFELKQKNRRREIEQLEQQLGALKERLQERQQLRDLIIDQYLKQLIGVQNPPDNR